MEIGRAEVERFRAVAFRDFTLQGLDLGTLAMMQQVRRRPDLLAPQGTLDENGDPVGFFLDETGMA